ncbi:MAG TPA: CDP-alcohol phosphatidyltransferase family protein [Dongiaceae bacterium]|jgi:CDP-diacylglycerol--glycerol-3-phosphate 3-phosphatidyltransferase
MPSIYQIKPAFQGVLRPLVRGLAGCGITANQVTIAALLMSLIAGVALTLSAGVAQAWFLLPVVLFLRMALNAIDGMLAREHDQKSALGAFLNELCDVFSDMGLYLPFACIPGVSAELVVAAVFLAVVSEMTGVVAVQVGVPRRYDGPMGKSDRAFAFGLIAFLLGCGVPSGVWLDWAIGAIAALTGLTIGNRVRAALRQAKS